MKSCAKLGDIIEGRGTIIIVISVNKSKKLINKVFVALFITMVAFTGITSTVSAAESSSTGNESVSMLASSYPTEVYVTESRSFSKNHALPPSTIYERRTINGFEYAGTLNRFSYYDADVRWLATYKGWIRAL